jgi:hypothetical protein
MIFAFTSQLHKVQIADHCYRNQEVFISTVHEGRSTAQSKVIHQDLLLFTWLESRFLLGSNDGNPIFAHSESIFPSIQLIQEEQGKETSVFSHSWFRLFWAVLDRMESVICHDLSRTSPLWLHTWWPSHPRSHVRRLSVIMATDLSCRIIHRLLSTVIWQDTQYDLRQTKKTGSDFRPMGRTNIRRSEATEVSQQCREVSKSWRKAHVFRSNRS